MRAFIIDGPHRGPMEVPEVEGYFLKLAVEPEDPQQGPVVYLYRRVEPERDDFLNGIDARYVWVP